MGRSLHVDQNSSKRCLPLIIRTSPQTFRCVWLHTFCKKSPLPEPNQESSKYFLKFLHISAPNSILLCSVRSSKDSQDVCSAELFFERHFSLENSQSVWIINNLLKSCTVKKYF